MLEVVMHPQIGASTTDTADQRIKRMELSCILK